MGQSVKKFAAATAAKLPTGQKQSFTAKVKSELQNDVSGIGELVKRENDREKDVATEKTIFAASVAPAKDLKKVAPKAAPAKKAAAPSLEELQASSTWV